VEALSYVEQFFSLAESYVYEINQRKNDENIRKRSDDFNESWFLNSDDDCLAVVEFFCQMLENLSLDVFFIFISEIA
jgi:hypothetical protein